MPTSEKPVVFLSHSSTDAKSLNFLRNLLLEKTGRSVKLFLSSDGQSIPFGKNWVYEVQQALSDCKLMFVFVTPASLQSSWIHFEAGFAYSKGIRVVPVGWNVDLGEIRPPLSLLQGFNILNVGGLNNILAVINDEFDHNHQNSFTENDFQSFADLSQSGTNSQVLKLSSLVRSISTKIPELEESCLEIAEHHLQQEHITHVCGERKDRISGFGFHITRASSNKDKYSFLIDLGFETLTVNLAMVFRLARILSNSDCPTQELRLTFEPEIVEVHPTHRVSDRLSGTEVTLTEKGLFNFRGLLFDVGHSLYMGKQDRRGPSSLKIIGDETALTRENICDLIELLLHCRVLVYQNLIEF